MEYTSPVVPIFQLIKLKKNTASVNFNSLGPPPPSHPTFQQNSSFFKLSELGVGVGGGEEIKI